MDRQSIIRDNWECVRSDVRNAAQAAGRDPDQIKIIGVTKYVDAETTRMLVDAGCSVLGENRPQVLWQKAESDELADAPVQWHMIGHVQRNKLRRMLRHQATIHSVDSQRLLGAIGDEAVARDETIDVLLEVNISGEEAKTGMPESELLKCIESAESIPVNPIGLMAMAGWGTTGDEARGQFAKVRELRDQLTAKTGLALSHLSMGMSGDFREAIAEGATMVRIGSRLFEGI